MAKACLPVVPGVALAALFCASLTACETVSFGQPAYPETTQMNLRLLVRAELSEARRLGLIPTGEAYGLAMNDAQVRSIAEAIEEATVGEVVSVPGP